MKSIPNLLNFDKHDKERMRQFKSFIKFTSSVFGFVGTLFLLYSIFDSGTAFNNSYDSEYTIAVILTNGFVLGIRFIAISYFIQMMVWSSEFVSH